MGLWNVTLWAEAKSKQDSFHFYWGRYLLLSSASVSLIALLYKKISFCFENWSIIKRIINFYWYLKFKTHFVYVRGRVKIKTSPNFFALIQKLKINYEWNHHRKDDSSILHLNLLIAGIFNITERNRKLFCCFKNFFF